MSHHFSDNGKAPEYAFKTYNAFLEQIDLRVVALRERGKHATVIDMLPMYAEKCWEEGDMYDAAMLYGLLGGSAYAKKFEIVTPYFDSSGTGQINVIFPVTPLSSNLTKKARHAAG